MVNTDTLKSFFKNKRVFVTGHTGFKGSWLIATLHLFGAKTKGYALAPEQSGGLFEHLESLSICQSVIADVRDRDRLKKELNDFQPDIVFHLAAQPLVRKSYEMPAETFDVNVTGTANLLESVIPLKKKCAVIVITTDKVYHNREEDVLYNEDDILGGYDPYSASKACAELVAGCFRQSFFNTVSYETHQKALATVRAGNVIGGGDWSTDRIFPDIANSLLRNEKILVRNPKAIRPWQHVLEAVAGYMLLAIKLWNEPLKFSKAYNFGPVPEDHLTVKELVERAINSWGTGSWQDVSSLSQPHEAGLLKLDIKRALAELEWQPRLNAFSAIDWTISWYKQPETDKATYTFSQINNYFQL